MNKVAAFALRRKNSILSMLEKMFCPPQPLRFWITPAYAGKSRMLCKAASQVWDHPRMCGEKSPVSLRFFALVGSPPRVRGKDTLGQIVHTGVGITPACAGKSLWSPLLLILAEDHPRVCGEKHPSTAIRQRNTGSPPRVRGKVRVQAPVQEHRGITPRLCGEKNDWQRIKEAYTGSPPRMRGKEKFAMAADMKLGITPAYAGKRSFRC